MDFSKDDLSLINDCLLFLSARIDNYIRLEESDDLMLIISALKTQASLLSLINKVQNKMEE